MEKLTEAHICVNKTETDETLEHEGRFLGAEDSSEVVEVQ